MSVSQSSTNLLLVDACLETQALILEIAKSKRLSVITATDPTVARVPLAGLVPHVVITDLFPHEQAGIEFIRHIRARHPHCATILVGHDVGSHTLLEAYRAGVAEFLPKPLGADKVRDALDRVVDQLPGARVHASGIEFLEYRLAFGSDVSCVERNVAWLISGSVGLLSEAQRVQVQATLIELILNAIEHGSLEISYQEKKEALEQDRYDALLTARRRDPCLAARLVTVRVLYEKRGRFLRYTVSDEGKGFQWKTLLEHWPGPPSIHHANGRGVYLARTFFPELSYNDDGNEATFTVPLP